MSEIHVFSPPQNYARQAHWHEDFVAHLAWISRPKVYVELGIETCRTFNRIVPFADKLIGVDINPGCKKHMVSSPKTEFVNCSTDQYAKILKKEPVRIDLLFIDANHSTKSVLTDFFSFLPYMVDQGLILLHDSYPESVEMTAEYSSGTCHKAIKKLGRRNDDYEIITLPFPPGLSICRKRIKHLSWERD